MFNSGFYFGGSLIQLVFAFFSQPIYAKYLSAEDFGILGYFTSVQGFFTPLFLFGMTQFYMMNYFRKNETENKVLLFNILAHLSIANVIISIIGFVCLYFIFSKLSVSVPFMPYSLLLLLILYFNIFTSFILINLRIRKKAFTFFLFSSLPPVLNVFFGLSFVISFHMGADGKMLGQVTTNFILGLLSLIYLRKFLIFKRDLSFFRKSLSQVLPLVGAGYAYYPINSLDKLFLERLDNLSELGFYSLGLTAANFINMASRALFMAFEPDIFKLVINRNFNKLKKLGSVFLLLVLFMIILFITFSPYLMDFLTSGRYTRAYKYANMYSIGIFFMQVFGFANAIIIALKKTKQALYVNLIGGVAAIISYFFMIRWFEFQGANIAYIIIGIVMACASFIYIRRELQGLNQ